MRFPGSLIGRRCSVSRQHAPATPTRKPHQVAFLSAFAEPKMSHRVPELMAEDLGDSRLHASRLESLIHPVGRHGASLAEPQLGTMAEPVQRPYAQVSIQSLSGPATEGHDSRSAELAKDDCSSILQVHVLNLETRQL
jgi:hypothetical protein